MAIFEQRVIERRVIVYQVEAETIEQAEVMEVEGNLPEKDSWYLDTEVGEPWHEIEGAKNG